MRPLTLGPSETAAPVLEAATLIRMHLVIFDVDGTLVQSTEVDTLCYARAVSEQLGLQVSTNWAEYRESTDSGILSELFDRHELPRCRRPAIRNAVRRRFVELLSEAIDSDPARCRPVRGACALLRGLSELRDVHVAIATGGWSSSARLKLNRAGISSDGFPFASSDDAEKRSQILQLAHQRASADSEHEFSDVTYVGDGQWDVRASAALGFRFVGIGCGNGREVLVSAGVEVILDHLGNQQEFIRHICEE